MTNDTREAIREEYSRGGAHYDSIRIESPRGQLLSKHDTALLERMLPAADDGLRVLEVGAGTGRFTMAALQHGFSLTATDVNEAQLASLREKLDASGHGERCKVQPEDIFKLSFDDGSFDFVYCLHTVPRFLTVDDQVAAIRELCRVTKPGGRLLFNYRNANSVYKPIYGGPRIKYSRVASLLGEQGMRVTEYRTKHLLNGRLLGVLPKFLWGAVSKIDLALENTAPSVGWDVFVSCVKQDG